VPIARDSDSSQVGHKAKCTTCEEDISAAVKQQPPQDPMAWKLLVKHPSGQLPRENSSKNKQKQKHCDQEIIKQHSEDDIKNKHNTEHFSLFIKKTLEM
jgi:hypothetical protein